MSASLGPGDPRRLGEYDLVRRLGEGGQGTVYLGIGPDGGKVAVKVLKGHTDPGTQRRLAREFEVLKRVNPFCTARLISYEDGRIVSEYVDGPSLQERVREQGALRGGELVRLAIGTASALAAIHDAGVVHRDFKPANVLLGPDGPRVVDFGIARPLDAGSSVTASVGTPGYIAPELLRGESVTAASDLFSWAATIVYAATGAHPFGAESVALIYQRILTYEPDLSAVPPELLPLVRACLAKDPAARPDAHEVLVGLVSPQTAGRLREPTVPVPERGPRGRRPSRTVWTAGGAGLLAVLLVAAFLLWPGAAGRTRRAPPRSPGPPRRARPLRRGRLPRRVRPLPECLRRTRGPGAAPPAPTIRPIPTRRRSPSRSRRARPRRPGGTAGAACSRCGTCATRAARSCSSTWPRDAAAGRSRSRRRATS